MRHPDWLVAMSTVIGVAGVAWPNAQPPIVVWNASRSVPIGLYYIIARPPLRDELAALRLPASMRSLANERGYLPTEMVLIKPVAAISGDVICRRGAIVTINDNPIAHALTADASGRPLPKWSGCFRADDQRFFVLSDDPDSFDGRYFGLVNSDRKSVV